MTCVASVSVIGLVTVPTRDTVFKVIDWAVDRLAAAVWLTVHVSCVVVTLT